MADPQSPPPRTVSQRDVRKYPLIGLIGLALLGAWRDDLVAVKAQSVEAKSLTVGGSFSAGTVYTFRLAGYLLTYTSVSGDTNLNGVAASIAAMINANPDVRGYVQAAPVGAVIGLSGLVPGESFELSETDANLSVATLVAASLPTAVPFGRLMMIDAVNTSERDPLTKYGKLAQALTAQVDTLLLTYSAATVYRFVFTVSDFVVALPVTADTNAADTITDVIAAVAANPTLVALGIVASSPSAGVVSFTAPAGTSFTLDYGIASGAGTLTAYTSNRGYATDFNAAAWGVSERHADNEYGADGVGTWAAGDNVPVVRKGFVWVETDTTETIRPGADVWVSEAADATAGRFYATPGASRRRLPRSKARWHQGARPGTQQNLALLFVDFA